MSQYRYDKDTGSVPTLNDSVEIIHTNSNLDGMVGTITGWLNDDRKYTALVELDTRLDSGERTIAIAVGCLKPYSNTDIESAIDWLWQGVTDGIITVPRAKDLYEALHGKVEGDFSKILFG